MVLYTYINTVGSKVPRCSMELLSRKPHSDHCVQEVGPGDFSGEVRVERQVEDRFEDRLRTLVDHMCLRGLRNFICYGRRWFNVNRLDHVATSLGFGCRLAEIKPIEGTSHPLHSIVTDVGEELIHLLRPWFDRGSILLFWSRPSRRTLDDTVTTEKLHDQIILRVNGLTSIALTYCIS